MRKDNIFSRRGYLVLYCDVTCWWAGQLRAHDGGGQGEGGAGAGEGGEGGVPGHPHYQVEGGEGCTGRLGKR